MDTAAPPDPSRRPLLAFGVAAALLYIAADLAAAALYPGYSIADQAVSELFAIGAPTAPLVVLLFSHASLLLLGFARGLWLSAAGNRALRLAAWMFAASAIDALLLWNLFPMHMRGAERGLTGAMHLALGANPFVWFAILFAAAALPGWFRLASIAALALLFAPALFAFGYAPALDAGLPTPGLGLLERAAQYGYQLWQCALALLLFAEWRRMAQLKGATSNPQGSQARTRARACASKAKRADARAGA
jgi:hypothetical protein